jgi:hypothetical protein
MYYKNKDNEPLIEGYDDSKKNGDDHKNKNKVCVWVVAVLIILLICYLVWEFVLKNRGHSEPATFGYKFY